MGEIYQATKYMNDGTLGSVVPLYKYPSLTGFGNAAPDDYFYYVGKTAPNKKGDTYIICDYVRAGSNSKTRCAFDSHYFNNPLWVKIVKAPSSKASNKPTAKVQQKSQAKPGFFQSLWNAFKLNFILRIVDFFRSVVWVTAKAFGLLFKAIEITAKAVISGLTQAITSNRKGFALLVLILFLVFFPSTLLGILRGIGDFIMGRTRKPSNNSTN